MQVALTCTQIWWTTEVGLAFARLEEGYENAIKDYNKKQVRGARVPPLRAAAPSGQPRFKRTRETLPIAHHQILLSHPTLTVLTCDTY